MDALGAVPLASRTRGRKPGSAYISKTRHNGYFQFCLGIHILVGIGGRFCQKRLLPGARFGASPSGAIMASIHMHSSGGKSRRAESARGTGFCDGSRIRFRSERKDVDGESAAVWPADAHDKGQGGGTDKTAARESSRIRNIQSSQSRNFYAKRQSRSFHSGDVDDWPADIDRPDFLRPVGARELAGTAGAVPGIEAKGPCRWGRSLVCFQNPAFDRCLNGVHSG